MGSQIDNAAIRAVKEITGMVRYFVDHPDLVEVNVIPHSRRITAELHTHPDDVGQVVGRQGHISSSLRSFLSAVAGKYRVNITLDYVTEMDNAEKRRKQAGLLTG